MTMDIAELADILHAEKCSCVIRNHGKLTRCHERGVKDLLEILHREPDTLSGAIVADKVVGKGAAALMILGGVSRVYADVISKKAMALFPPDMLDGVTYGKLVEGIVNRAGTGPCPVESLCKDCRTAEECLPLIEGFVRENQS